MEMMGIKKPKAWSFTTAQDILRMHDSGSRIKDVCARYGLHHSQVQQFLRWNNRAPHPRSYITGPLLEDIIRLYETERRTARSIAAYIGVSDSTVRDALHRANVIFRPRTKLTEGEQRRACALYRSGTPYTKIAHQYGCSEEAIRDTIHRYGVEIRPKRKLDARSLPQILRLYEQRITPAAIGMRYGVNENTVKKAVLDAGGALRGIRDDVHRRIPLDVDAFRRDSEEAQYWIGLLMTDGNVSENGTLSLALQNADIEHLHKLRRFLKSKAPIIRGRVGPGAYKPGAKFARLSVSSKNLVDSLKEVGVIPNKTGREVLLKYQFSRHTWRGAIDGDGTLGWHKRGYFYIKLYGSKQFCQQFRQYVLTVIMDCRAQVQKSKSIYSFGLCCKPAEKVAIELYRDCVVALTRKHDIVKELLQLKKKWQIHKVA